MPIDCNRRAPELVANLFGGTSLKHLHFHYRSDNRVDTLKMLQKRLDFDNVRFGIDFHFLPERDLFSLLRQGTGMVDQKATHQQSSESKKGDFVVIVCFLIRLQRLNFGQFEIELVDE